MIDRPGLADFLRRRRDLLRPEDVGLGTGARRRARGLRREEVAQLAGMSTDYYARIEQNRGPNPSEPIIASLARALRLDLDERDHLYRLAGFAPPPHRPGRFISPGLLALADRLADVPILISDDLEVVRWQNALATAFAGPISSAPGFEASITWQWFAQPERRVRFPEEHWERTSIAHVADLRATWGRRGRDADVAGMIASLQERSAEFRELWDRHDVVVRHLDRKTFLVPQIGELHLTCESLLTTGNDLRLRAFFPTEGTDAREKLDLLAVLGTQRFEGAALD